MARPIEKRAAIERAAVEVIARTGLAGATIQEIATAAQVSAGLLYRYWKNVDELAVHAYRARYHALLQRLAAAAAARPDPLDKLAEMIRAFAAQADEDPLLLRFLLLQQHELAPRAGLSDGIVTQLRQLIEQAIAQRMIRPLDAEIAALMILGLVLQPLAGVMHGTVPGPPSRHVALLLSGVKRLLGASPVRK